MADLPGCPYCGRTLRYVANRWFGHNVFECEQCGDFPDFRVPITAAATAAGGGPAEHSRAHRPSPPRVLLVDDAFDHLELYAQMLSPVATVITASRGEQAVALACADPPDAILLDVMMPGMDGWETCRQLKANSLTSDVP